MKEKWRKDNKERKCIVEVKKWERKRMWEGLCCFVHVFVNLWMRDCRIWSAKCVRKVHGDGCEQSHCHKEDMHGENTHTHTHKRTQTQRERKATTPPPKYTPMVVVLVVVLVVVVLLSSCCCLILDRLPTFSHQNNFPLSQQVFFKYFDLFFSSFSSIFPSPRTHFRYRFCLKI